MGREPRLDFRGFVNLRVVGDNGEVSKERGGVRAIERGEQINKKSSLFAIPPTMGDGARGQLSGTGQIALLVGAWRQHLDLFPFGHPLRADLG